MVAGRSAKGSEGLSTSVRVAVLFRSDHPAATVGRLETVVEALASAGAVVELVEFDDARQAEARSRLSRLDGVLVWADPRTEAGERLALDGLLRELSAGGVWVSAHPDVVDKMGTKEVLYTTRTLGWGTDTQLYESAAQFRAEFPARLAADGTRVIKTSRGSGGRGVWKVRLLGDGRTSLAGLDAQVAVQHARVRDETTTAMTLGDFIVSCSPLFDDWGGRGRLVDQAFCRAISRGIIRCYLVGDRVVGFARQFPDSGRVETIMGLPSSKTMYGPDEREFSTLRAQVEKEWVPAMQARLGVATVDLPALWDADFLYGEPTPGGDRYVLCEINVSSILPFPPGAPAVLAKVAVERIVRAK